MTKVQVHYELMHPLDDAAAGGVANVHSYYGILRVYVAPALDKITVDFDASRLGECEVEAALIRAGVPIRRQAVEATTAV